MKKPMTDLALAKKMFKVGSEAGKAHGGTGAITWAEMERKYPHSTHAWLAVARWVRKEFDK